ncbi:radical SAM protein [Streptomyces sp. NPDC019645]|uniref:radical SAM protein n=1 Tax=Streptomyces sp. NPDC019645 TaxID=3154786 RepID=UPI0033E776D9
MPVEVARAVATPVNQWAAANPRFEVVWHGEEPLAAGREHLAALMAPFEDVKHSVQTNAALIDDTWCEFLLEHQVHVGVSIDGPEDMNTHRLTPAGRPGFRVIMRGIERLRRHGIPISAAGFNDRRFGDFATGNVLHTGLDVLVAEAEERTPWITEFWNGVDACDAACPTFAFCGGAHAANRYFEHDGRFDATRTRYCTTAKMALLEGVTRHVREHRP